MREKVEMTRYACDDPKCPVVVYVEDEVDGPPDGFHGNARQIASWGGTASAEWYACRAQHIRAAVEGAMQREREQEHP